MGQHFEIVRRVAYEWWHLIFNISNDMGRNQRPMLQPFEAGVSFVLD